jgi:hypothetical protein
VRKNGAEGRIQYLRIRYFIPLSGQERHPAQIESRQLRAGAVQREDGPSMAMFDLRQTRAGEEADNAREGRRRPRALTPVPYEGTKARERVEHCRAEASRWPIRWLRRHGNAFVKALGNRSAPLWRLEQSPAF